MSAPELVDFADEGADHWVTLKLKDGTVLKVKMEIAGVMRMGNDPNTGIPIYAVQTTNVVRLAQVPQGLVKQPQGKQGGMYH
ncbi:MAG: hypothetical protein JRN26_05545 [Nitrososphaerota archaeon]|jgi:hypothetical protein|nr:hypothetical protein [Nitrososphaerota archaeon]MDG6927189.1 hypothetical protein [Nitrososphaerota archaeon]MDG6930823.1 hypothetical protein [Nitrososphaerota archaeon]MDG6932267.1 hypothetical protein [Nitrososphaerota archaeon]MDG6936328.1 hypothetical protein [Nitrososphaerota archaeon]